MHVSTFGRSSISYVVDPVLAINLTASTLSMYFLSWFATKEYAFCMECHSIKMNTCYEIAKNRMDFLNQTVQSCVYYKESVALCSLLGGIDERNESGINSFLKQKYDDYLKECVDSYVGSCTVEEWVANAVNGLFYGLAAVSVGLCACHLFARAKLSLQQHAWNPIHPNRVQLVRQ